jgi:uncharacterized membrane protein YkvA (DUF1232 family)
VLSVHFLLRKLTCAMATESPGIRLEPAGAAQPKATPMKSRILQRSAGPNSSWLQQQSAKWNGRLRSVVRQTRVMAWILKHPDVPWSAKFVAACALAYILSPIQLIPSFIPVIGQLDDLTVLFVGAKLVRALVPCALLAECEAKAESHPCRAHPTQPLQAEYGPQATI